MNRHTKSFPQTSAQPQSQKALNDGDKETFQYTDCEKAKNTLRQQLE